MKKIRAGLIGTGGISRVHLEWMKSREDVVIAALCDIDPAALERRASVYGGARYAEYEAMLANEDLDAVWVCTPPLVRKGPLVICAEKGIPVFCEKPASVDESSASDISAALAAKSGRVMIGYPFRALPIVKTLRAALAEDRIHTVQSLYLCDVSLTMGLRPWFYELEKSGGAMVDQATHVFDLLRTLMGEVVEVKAIGSNPVRRKADGYTIDEAIGLAMLYENGAVGTHTHSWVADTWRTEIMLSGEHRLYRLDLTSGSLTITEAGRSTTHTYQGSLYTFENDYFAGMVTSGDWSANLCDYDDAARSLSLTLQCNRALAQ